MNHSVWIATCWEDEHNESICGVFASKADAEAFQLANKDDCMYGIRIQKHEVQTSSGFRTPWLPQESAQISTAEMAENGQRAGKAGGLG